MEHLIYPNLKKQQISGIRQFTSMLVNYPDAINLTIGQPDFPTPSHIKESAKQAIDQNRTSYTPNAGVLELRKAISQFYEEKYGLSYNPNDEVVVTHGATGAIMAVLRTILTEGCEVIVPAPIYPGYVPIIEMFGGVPIYVDTTTTNFVLTAELIEKHLTEQTRAIFLCSPSNPIGTIIEKNQLQEIAKLLNEKEIFTISDEIYSELLYEKTHHSIASFEGMREKTIIINGVSKSHSMTGWRIGYTLAPKYISKELTKVIAYFLSCESSISQYAALEALTVGKDDAIPMREEYLKRRNFVYSRLVGIGFDVVKPEGAFYMFPSIKQTNMKSFDFCLSLLKEQGVATVPGSAFSHYGEGYVRISFAQPIEKLEEAMGRLEKFMEQF